MHVFYAPDAVSGSFKLSSGETHHCLNVLRFRKGDTILVSNGKGFLAECVVSDTNLSGLLVRTEKILQNRSDFGYSLHIAISPVKNMSRFEWFVEKAAELKVAEITPLICKRTEKMGIRTDRLRKIALEAMKQSASDRITLVNEPHMFIEFLNIHFEGYSRYIASCSDMSKKPVQGIHDNKCIVMIGPEGDFTDSEIAAAQNSGYCLLDLGEARLRTETAGLLTAATFYLNYLVERK